MPVEYITSQMSHLCNMAIYQGAYNIQRLVQAKILTGPVCGNILTRDREYPIVIQR